MRRAFIAATVSLRDSFAIATEWAQANPLTVIAPMTADVVAESWLQDAGVPIGVTSKKHSRFTARPQGTLVAWCLDLHDLLDQESQKGVQEVVLVRAHGVHAPWITAHGVECLAGTPVPAVPEASPAIKAMVQGVTNYVIRNQGLVDERERWRVIQALTYFRQCGHTFDRDQLSVEALRQGWPGNRVGKLAELASDVNAGKRLRFEQRLRPEVVAEWEQTQTFEHEN